MKADAQKGGEAAGSGTALPQDLPNSKNTFPGKYIFT